MFIMSSIYNRNHKPKIGSYYFVFAYQ